MHNCTDKLEKLVINIANDLYTTKIKANVIVGAECKQPDKCYVRCCRESRTIDLQDLINDLHPIVKKKLKSLGKIGEKRNGNSLGYCAEVHAASCLLKLSDAQGIKLKDIKFSNAYRPRTLMPKKIDYCQNCLDTFNITN